MTLGSAHADSHTRDGFVHEALLYGGRDEFLAGALAFIREGLAAGEPILVVVEADKIRALRGELNGDAGRVHYADMADVGTNPARIIPAWRDFVDRHGEGGRSVRGIGEPIWAGRTACELVECQLHESLLNLAFADAPAFRLLCPYDTDALEDWVIAEALCSHPNVVDREDRRASRAYRGLEAISAPFDEPLPDPPAAAHELAFESASLGAARQLVYISATAAGLSVWRMHDLALAVSEVATNSVLHGGGEGVLRVWEDGDALICEVRDRGRIDRPLIGRERPDDERDGGRGLWIAKPALRACPGADLCGRQRSAAAHAYVLSGRLAAAPIAAAAIVLVAGCGGDSGSATPEAAPSSVEWPAPADPNARTREAGLEPGRKETLIHHVHAHLDVFVDGKAVLVPAGIGINIADPGVKSGTNPVAYGGIEECDEPCISPLHTHDESGVLHTESAREVDNTLGQFFTEWDVKLDESCVGEFCRPETEIAVYVDGETYEGDPREIALTNGKQIAIVVGDPPSEIPSTYDFSNA